MCQIVNLVNLSKFVITKLLCHSVEMYQVISVVNLVNVVPLGKITFAEKSIGGSNLCTIQILNELNAE